MEYNFPVTRTTHPKPRPADETKLGFAKYFTDHMFVMDYDEGQGWHDGRVVPHEPFLIEPASCVLHYAQMMFEGMKAYRTPDGGIQIFRPDMNIKRMARTNERMCIPELPGDLFLAAVISPIGWLNVMGTDVQVADGTVGPVAQKLYDTLYGMQTGTVADDMGWTYRLL